MQYRLLCVTITYKAVPAFVHHQNFIVVEADVRRYWLVGTNTGSVLILVTGAYTG